MSARPLAPDWEVVRKSGKGWCATRNGERISAYTRNPENAERAMEAAQRREARTSRKCLCCASVFTSEGIGNRMCQQCKDKAARAMI